MDAADCVPGYVLYVGLVERDAARRGERLAARVDARPAGRRVPRARLLHREYDLAEGEKII